MSDRLGDPAENHKAYDPAKKYHHGWVIEHWVKYIRAHPECSLPNGVGAALIELYERKETAANIMMDYKPDRGQ